MKMKNIFIAMVDLLQNISKHAYSNSDIKDGLFALSKKYDNFMVSTGNYMKSSKVDELKIHLDLLNTLNSEALEDLYSETLMNSLDSDSDAAGLGLINLAQTTLKPFEFHFEHIDDEKSFFTITATV